MKKLTAWIVGVGFTYLCGYWYFDTQVLNKYEKKDLRLPTYFDAGVSSEEKGQIPRSNASTSSFEPTLDSCKRAELALKKREHLQNNELRKFHRNNDSVVSNEIIAMLAGIPLEDYRYKKTTHVVRQDLANLAYVESNAIAGIGRQGLAKRGVFSTLSNVASEKHLLDLIDAKDFEQLSLTLEKQPKYTHHINNVDLMSVVILRHPSIDMSDVLSFIGAGIKPTLFSFLQVYSHPNRLELLETLFSNSDGIPLDTVWMNGFYLDNLLIDALRNSDIEIAYFWYLNGVPASVAHNQPNALDVFPKPRLPEHEVAKQLLTQLLADIKYPYEYVRYEVVNEIIAQIPGMELSEYAIPAVEVGPITAAQIAKLKERLAKYKNFEGTITPREYSQCLQLDGFNEYRFANAPTVLIQPTAKERIENVESFQNFYLPMVGLFTGTEELLNRLFDEYGIDDNLDIAKLPELVRAISEQKKKEEIVSIAEDIAVIPNSVVLALTANSRWDLFDYFLNRGLDINYADEHGRGPLYYSLSSLKPYRTFAYLAQKGAKPQAPDQLMRKAIAFTLRDKNYIKVLEWTVHYVPVKQEHLTYFYEIAVEDQPNYEAVLRLLEKQSN